MQRRTLLKSATSAAALLTASNSRAMKTVTPTKSVPAAADSYPFLRIDPRASLFYKDWGACKASRLHAANPVLFVHGWSLNSDMWQYQMLHLSNHGVRTLAYDRRGHGRSTDPGLGYDIDTLADDLAAVINQLDLRDVILVGHSMGAAEVVRFLSRHGASRVSRVLLLSTTLPFILKTRDNPQGIDKTALDQIRAALATDFPKWLTENAPPFFRPETTPRMVEWGINMCQQASLKALIETNIALTETDFRAELRKLKTPVFLIHGDHDVSAPLDFTARRTAQLIPGAQLQIYEGGPHGLFVTHMDRLNRDLLAFVNG
jgi:non-heme chloroperoxidase